MHDELERYASPIPKVVPTDADIDTEYDALLEDALDFNHYHTSPNLVHPHHHHPKRTVLTILAVVCILPLFAMTTIGFLGMARGIIVLLSVLLHNPEFGYFIGNTVIATVGWGGMFACYKWLTKNKDGL